MIWPLQLGTQMFRAQRDWGDNASWWKEWKEDQFVKSSEERWGVNSSILSIITNEVIALLCLHGSGWARIYPGKLHGSDPLSKTPWGLCLAPWPPSAQPPSRAGQINQESRWAGCEQTRLHCTKLQTWAYLKPGIFLFCLASACLEKYCEELLPFSEASCMGHSQRQISGPIRPIISQDVSP